MKVDITDYRLYDEMGRDSVEESVVPFDKSARPGRPWWSFWNPWFGVTRSSKWRWTPALAGVRHRKGLTWALFWLKLVIYHTPRRVKEKA